MERKFFIRLAASALGLATVPTLHSVSLGTKLRREKTLASLAPPPAENAADYIRVLIAEAQQRGEKVVYLADRPWTICGLFVPPGLTIHIGAPAVVRLGGGLRGIAG